MTSETSSRVFSNSAVFLKDLAKFVKQSIDDFAKFFEESINDSATCLEWSKNFSDTKVNDSVISLNWADSFSLSVRKNLFDLFFDEKSLNRLNDIFINLLNDLLFRDNAFEMINLMNWNVFDVSEIWMSCTSFSAEDDLSFSCVVRCFFNRSA